MRKRTTLARCGHCLVVLLAAAALAAAGSTPTRYHVVEGSQFWIDGTSTLGGFRCAGQQIEGQALVSETDARVAAEVTVPVESFDCGRARMTRDLRRALQEDEHPLIRIVVDHAEVIGEVRGEAWVPVEATARIRLAGVERSVVMRAEGRERRPGRVEIRGEQALLMTDFGIDPPSGLMGVVRAHDRVVARFDLRAASE